MLERADEVFALAEKMLAKQVCPCHMQFMSLDDQRQGLAPACA